MVNDFDISRNYKFNIKKNIEHLKVNIIKEDVSEEMWLNMYNLTDRKFFNSQPSDCSINFPYLWKN